MSTYSRYCFSNASLTDSGKIYLSNPIKLTWTSEEPTEESWGTCYYKSCDQKKFYVDYYSSFETSYNHTTTGALFITSGSMTNMYSETTSTDLYYTNFSIDRCIYAMPTAHSSNYTLIKVKNKSTNTYRVPDMNNQNNDGSYELSKYYYIEGGISGYGKEEIYDDTKDSDGNYTDVRFCNYDGYYWEYEGQHY